MDEKRQNNPGCQRTCFFVSPIWAWNWRSSPFSIQDNGVLGPSPWQTHRGKTFIFKCLFKSQLCLFWTFPSPHAAFYVICHLFRGTFHGCRRKNRGLGEGLPDVANENTGCPPRFEVHISNDSFKHKYKRNNARDIHTPKKCISWLS